MPKHIDHEQRKIDIAEMTLQMIHQHGIDKTTLREIAKEAGLSLGSLQYHFPRQKDLFGYTMEMLYIRTTDRIEGVIDNDLSEFDNVVNMLTQMTQVHNQEQRMENDVWAQLSLMRDKTPEFTQLVNRYLYSYNEYYKEALKILDDNDHLSNKNGMDDEINTFTIFMNGLLYETVLFPDKYDEKIVEDQIRAYLSKICLQS